MLASDAVIETNARIDVPATLSPEVRADIVRLLGEAVGHGPGTEHIVIVNNKAEGCSPRSLVHLAAAFDRA